VKIMKNKQKFLLFVTILGIVFATFGPALAVEPILGEVTLNPEHPTKLSKITFIATIIGEDIKTVKIIVLECNASTGICQNTRDNQTMHHIGGDIYETNITLDYAPASYITYWVYVESITGETSTLPDVHGIKLNLSVGSSNGDSDNGDNSNGNGKTPGFEAALFIAAVCGALILIGRKRSR
jgi:uncharacterized membrane protein YeaQ/YmgE (transglycosylase-associated protein family)